MKFIVNLRNATAKTRLKAQKFANKIAHSGDKITVRATTACSSIIYDRRMNPEYLRDVVSPMAVRYFSEIMGASCK
jgi:hypothetical protein